MILESTHHEEMEKRNFYQQVYFKLNAHLDALDDLNIQLTSTSKDEDLDYYNQIIDSIHEQHEKLMNFINDVFVWRDRKDMGAYLGEIPSVEISEEEQYIRGMSSARHALSRCILSFPLPYSVTYFRHFPLPLTCINT